MYVGVVNAAGGLDLVLDLGQLGLQVAEFTVSTRFGTRSWRRLSCTSIPLHASPTLLRDLTSPL
jgi:hypothetical protein